MAISLCTNRDEMRQHVVARQHAGERVGLVPTMGALHEGHLSLVKASTSACDSTIVTIFVNPTQFGPNEDFEKYPRDLDRDMQLLDGLGVDIVFSPSSDELYSPTHSTFVQPPKVSEPLEGALRPGHFQGVATIVLKLFSIIPANVAFFGQKDYQQTRVIQAMVSDFDLPISIQVCPTVREPDGLALSSRNAYLSESERAQSLSIAQALDIAVAKIKDGESDAATVSGAMLRHLNDAGIEKIDYVALADADTLQAVVQAKPGDVALIAAYVGSTRLIDNVILG